MHEYSVAYDIYATTRRAALENHANRVKHIYIDIGELSMVNPEQVKFLFDLLIEDDPLFKGVVFEYRIVEPQTRCACGYEGSEKFVCPECGALPEMIKGREIMVTNIEIEVDES